MKQAQLKNLQEQAAELAEELIGHITMDAGGAIYINGNMTDRVSILDRLTDIQTRVFALNNIIQSIQGRKAS